MPASWTRRTATFALVTLVAAVHATHARHGRSLRLDRHPAAAPASSTPSHRSDAPAAAAGAFAASNGVRRLFQSLAEAAPSPEGGALEPRGDLNLSTTALGTDGLRGVLDYLRVTLLASGDAADRAISEQATALLQAAPAAAAAALAPALDALLSSLGQPDPVQPQDRVAGRPAIRRLVSALLVHMHLQSHGHATASEDVQQRVHRLLCLLFDSHRGGAERKGLIHYYHVSKSGGTSMCFGAVANSCKTEAPGMIRTCQIKRFDDGPRWVVKDFGDAQLIPPELHDKQVWAFNFGTPRDPDSLAYNCSARASLLRENNWTFYQSEYSLVPGASQPCKEFVNVIIFRDPMVRVMSHLLWIQKTYLYEYRELMKFKFVNRTSSFWLQLAPAAADNYYTRTLLGEELWALPLVPIRPSHVQAAKQQLLSFDLVAVLGKDTRALDVGLEVGLGWWSTYPKRRYRSSHQDPNYMVLPTDLPVLAQHNQPDYEVFRLAQQLSALDTLLFDYIKASGHYVTSGARHIKGSGCGYVGAAAANAARQRRA